MAKESLEGVLSINAKLICEFSLVFSDTSIEFSMGFLRFSFEFLKLGGHDFSLDRSVDSDKSFRLWVLELLLSGKFCDGSFLGWSSKLFCTVELDESDSDESYVDSKDTKNFFFLDLHKNCIYMKNI